MPKYTEEHYEDIAGILLYGLGIAVAGQLSGDEVVRLIMGGFGNLFEDNNPAYCSHCGQPKGTPYVFCHSPDEEHNFEGGFDREGFLRACGLGVESNADGDCSGCATCVDHPEDV